MLVVAAGLGPDGFQVSSCLSGIALVFEDPELGVAFLAKEFYCPANYHVGDPCVFAFLDYFGARVKIFFCRTVVELGFKALREVIEPLEMRKEIGLFLVFPGV